MPSLFNYLLQALTQLGITQLFHDWNGPLSAILILSLVFGATAVAGIWPNLKSSLSKEVLSRFIGLIGKRRFEVALVCLGLVALQDAWPRSWHRDVSPATRLVLVFQPMTSNPTETGSSNVHWSHWSGLQEDNPPLIDADDRPMADDRKVWASDVTVLFLRFDAPVDYDRLTLAMADSSRVPEAKTYRKDERTAVLVIQGRIKRGVALTIEPVSDVGRHG